MDGVVGVELNGSLHPDCAHWSRHQSVSGFRRHFVGSTIELYQRFALLTGTHLDQNHNTDSVTRCAQPSLLGRLESGTEDRPRRESFYQIVPSTGDGIVIITNSSSGGAFI